jgi:xanthine/CO dehydrogenase XdhC/CoxF family maturation factor
MKHRKETGEIVARVGDLVAAGRRAVLATAVCITGSSYRRPGAKFLIEDDGATLGGVSGGCLEVDVRVIALEVMRTGKPRLLHYDTGADDRTIWGLGLGCNGSVDVFVQSVTTPPTREMLQAVGAMLEQDAEPVAISTVVVAPDGVGRSVVVDAGGVLAGTTGSSELDARVARLAAARLAEHVSRVDDIDGRLVFTDVLAAPPRLIVCGAGDDAGPLVRYAADVGFAVTVVDHRPAYLSHDRFPSARRLVQLQPHEDVAALGVNGRTFVVVKTHSFARDRDWVSTLIQAGAPYIGLLGPRARREQIVAQLRGSAAQVFGPVGLDIGADGPEQIAISIVAELLAVRGRRDGGHLRKKVETIHAV